MSCDPQIPALFSQIDRTNRDEYRYITETDACYYIWERMSQVKGDYYKYPTNNFISNFKIPVSLKKSRPTPHDRWYYKLHALQFAARALGALMPTEWRDYTFVPIPPSKTKTDPYHDPRCLRTLQAVQPALPDVRELILLTESAEAEQKGLTPYERAEHYQINAALIHPEPQVVFLFDDVFTTGCHFKAAELVLKSRFPYVMVVGIFLARAVRPGPEPLENSN